MPIDLSHKEARRLALHRQGLLQTAAFGRGPKALLSAIERLHHVQIDTISVVDRAHHHILQARIPGYRQQWLHQAQSVDRSVFEYWYHAAAYLPMADYRFYLPIMGNYARRHLIDARLRREILARIRDQGSVEAGHFEREDRQRSSGWWDWKPAKVTMERMFFAGELMVKERQGFRKRYGLTRDLLPAGTDTTLPTDQERGAFYLRIGLGAHGIASERDLLYARTAVRNLCGHDIRPALQQALAEQVESGAVTRCTVAGQPYYCLTAALEALPARLGRRRIRFLSPFDNLIINRRRLKALFGFDYQLECYVPAARRRFGYFVLPILWGDAFVGRLGCKMQRKEGVLDVMRLWLEPGVRDDALLEQMDDALQDYCLTLGGTAVRRLDRSG
ncbi:MAG: hypothetical protein RLZZ385_92 [Pseudomonadota bacterium]